MASARRAQQSSARRAYRARVDQYKRSWNILRQNTLALVGIGILVGMAFTAIYALTQPIPWYQLTLYCASNQSNGSASDCLTSLPSVCTYPAGSLPPHPGCYQTPSAYPSVIPPTITWNPPSAGPLPFGSLTLEGGLPYFYNTFQGLLRGSDWSLMFSVTIVGAGALIGLVLGGLSGYFGGVLDEVIMRLTDTFLAVPGLLLIIVFITAIQFSVHSLFGLDETETLILILIIGFVITWWPFYTRVVRGLVLVVREQKYVESARASGARTGRILRRHILPNSLYPVWIQFALDVGTVPLGIGAINFLGFQILPTVDFPEWGAITALSAMDVTNYLTTCQLPSGCIIPWWQLLFPGLMLTLFALSVNFLGDGLRDALDPRLRR